MLGPSLRPPLDMPHSREGEPHSDRALAFIRTWPGTSLCIDLPSVKSVGDPATFTVSKHNKPRPCPSAFSRIVGILIGVLLLLVVYYVPWQKDFLSMRAMGTAAALGLLLTVGVLWGWFRDWRRNRPK